MKRLISAFKISALLKKDQPSRGWSSFSQNLTINIFFFPILFLQALGVEWKFLFVQLSYKATVFWSTHLAQIWLSQRDTGVIPL